MLLVHHQMEAGPQILLYLFAMVRDSIFVDYGGYIYIYILQDTEVEVIVLWINTCHFHLF